jgi:hypothetical protein
MNVTPSNIHRILAEKMPREHFSHWYSDLYVKVTPFSREVVSQYEYKHLVKTFIDQIDSELWYEIPFCYNKEV